MFQVLLARPSDSSGYTTLILDEPVGTTQAGEEITATKKGVEQSVLLHGQREVDVIEGTTVTFPDGTVYKPGK